MNFIHNQLINTFVFIKDKLEERDDNLTTRKRFFARDPNNQELKEINEDGIDDLNNLNTLEKVKYKLVVIMEQDDIESNQHLD